MVNGKKYPYTPAGKAAAEKAMKKITPAKGKGSMMGKPSRTMSPAKSTKPTNSSSTKPMQPSRKPANSSSAKPNKYAYLTNMPEGVQPRAGRKGNMKPAINKAVMGSAMKSTSNKATMGSAMKNRTKKK